MPLSFRAYDPTKADYPRARVPVLPELSGESIGRSTEGGPRSAFSAPDVLHLSRARYALFIALRALGIGPSDSVLLPSYHCRTMLDPVLRLGADIVLYPVSSALQIDFDDLRRLVRSGPKPPKALVLVHFFGFPSDPESALEFCATHRMALVEDCSHAWFGEWNKRPLGSFGEHAIASPRKFFPCEDGGILLSKGGRVGAALQAPSVTNQVKAACRAVASGIGLRGTRVTRSAFSVLDSELLEIRHRHPRWQAEATELDSVSPSSEYEAGHETTRALATTKLTIRFSNPSQLSNRRRIHYRKWVDAVSQLPHCRALHPDVPTGVVPYMFPLLIDEPAARFHWLKKLGVPMYRWDQLAVSGCPIAEQYRLGLIHLPCHQSLNEQEMDWMIAAVTAVASADTAPAAI